MCCAAAELSPSARRVASGSHMCMTGEGDEKEEVDSSAGGVVFGVTEGHPAVPRERFLLAAGPGHVTLAEYVLGCTGAVSQQLVMLRSAAGCCCSLPCCCCHVALSDFGMCCVVQRWPAALEPSASLRSPRSPCSPFRCVFHACHKNYAMCFLHTHGWRQCRGAQGVCWADMHMFAHVARSHSRSISTTTVTAAAAGCNGKRQQLW